MENQMPWGEKSPAPKAPVTFLQDFCGGGRAENRPFFFIRTFGLRKNLNKPPKNVLEGPNGPKTWGGGTYAIKRSCTLMG